ncbi:type II toxin-antitoxin system Phd/YefM family antitoxin [Desulfitibacter alkalitolerans]|jgi:prevent-host-death family protein|uniref:type II toxin-antitoxin system Phd/YefM family antitoxin n=1 Tax=Desulfitibacter alkalitolerans TaxID=264641 RepID=UPI000484AB5F|nr:type II toxin-antitoxin system Phd/YefM family antitoxin [Desulfitibacter alkalitolerans]
MTDKKINVHEAKTHFSKLVARVINGEEFIIAKAGKPVARLLPIKEKASKRLPGSAKGKIFISPDFNSPLPEDMLKEFEE